MLHSRLAHDVSTGGPSDGSKRKKSWRQRLGAGLSIASIAAMGVAQLSVPQAAQALTAIDGQWTVSHGGTGQIMLNTDGTYTSTCEANPDYENAYCPAPSGTFRYSTMSTASVTFDGADGSSTSFRVSGLVSSPDTITSVFGNSVRSLVMKKGPEFVCTDWGGPHFSRLHGLEPTVQTDPATGDLWATGSHEKPVGMWTNLAETAPNYYQIGMCDDLFDPPEVSTIVIDGAVDASVPADIDGRWLPRATVTIKDPTGTPVAGATVDGAFTSSFGAPCVTAADGTCTVAALSTVSNSTAGSTFRASSVALEGAQWDDHGLVLDLHRPAGSDEVPASHHVANLDQVTTSFSSARAWQPRVAVTVIDGDGAPVAGATVRGTFSSYEVTLDCVTGDDGICQLGNFTLSRRIASTDFTVTGVMRDSSAYDPAANSDPGRDSNGTTITLHR